nr:1,4-alpha-glucan branching protein domain-containing protein [Cerasicoccus arenae]
MHAHLPFGLRPELPVSLEEAWLFEATIDCYLPLLELISAEPGKKPRLAASLSPTLLEQWSHHDFTDRFAAHLDRLAAILKRECSDQSLPKERRELAEEMLLRNAQLAAHFVRKWSANLSAAWGHLASEGKVELLTTAATHAFLPAHQNSPLTRRLQIQLGIERFTALTGITPQGFWLPECGYYPGLEYDLAEAGIQWFAVENMNGSSVVRCPNDVTAIARQGELSQKVWDAHSGYPGHANYREFHQDAVHQLSHEQAGLYRLPDGGSLPLGLKYWRVTGKGEKDWYDPVVARQQAETDAQDFIESMARTPESFIFLPFDAELFGHWWHEGPYWLENVIQRASQHPALTLASPTDAISSLKDIPEGLPAASTWGHRADYSFWINPETDWIYPLLANAGRKLKDAIARSESDPLRRRAVNQLARELLLAQASDWPFMLRAGATAGYAEERLRRHLTRFQFLLNQLATEEIDAETLHALEQLDPIQPNLDLQRF